MTSLVIIAIATAKVAAWMVPTILVGTFAARAMERQP